MRAITIKESKTVYRPSLTKHRDQKSYNSYLFGRKDLG